MTSHKIEAAVALLSSNNQTNEIEAMAILKQKPVSPRIKTIHPQRPSYAQLPLPTSSAASSRVVYPRTSAEHKHQTADPLPSYFTPSSPTVTSPHLGSAHSPSAHTRSTPLSPTRSVLAPLPASLAVGRQLAASKSLRDLEADRHRIRVAEDRAANPSTKMNVHPYTSRYQIGVYELPSAMSHRIRRFKATYDQPEPSATSSPSSTKLTISPTTTTTTFKAVSSPRAHKLGTSNASFAAAAAASSPFPSSNHSILLSESGEEVEPLPDVFQPEEAEETLVEL